MKRIVVATLTCFLAVSGFAETVSITERNDLDEKYTCHSFNDDMSVNKVATIDTKEKKATFHAGGESRQAQFTILSTRVPSYCEGCRFVDAYKAFGETGHIQWNKILRPVPLGFTAQVPEALKKYTYSYEVVMISYSNPNHENLQAPENHHMSELRLLGEEMLCFKE